MRDHNSDPRVTARPNGGWDVATSDGSYHVLDSGALGWGIYTGQNLDLVFGSDGPAIGAANGEDLINALLDHDDTTRTAGHTATAEADDLSDDTDGM